MKSLENKRSRDGMLFGNWKTYLQNANTGWHGDRSDDDQLQSLLVQVQPRLLPTVKGPEEAAGNNVGSLFILKTSPRAPT